MNWFEFKSLSVGRELQINGDIGSGGVTAKAFIEALNKGKGPIIVNINSAGGVVVEGVAIYNALKKYPGRITVNIDSLAASMATVIAMAGDVIRMQPNGLFMIHNPHGVTAGDARDHAKTQSVLEKMKVSMLQAYQDKTGLETEKLSSLMDEETWFDGNEALAHGFVDELDQVADKPVALMEARLLVASKEAEQVTVAQQAASVSIEETALKIVNARNMKMSGNSIKNQFQKNNNNLGIRR